MRVCQLPTVCAKEMLITRSELGQRRNKEAILQPLWQERGNNSGLGKIGALKALVE